jgi:antitoxin component YwqK of YwqJK toxin-antitoxin module
MSCRILLLILACLAWLPTAPAQTPEPVPRAVQKFTERHPSGRPRRLYQAYLNANNKRVLHGTDIYFYDQPGNLRYSGTTYRDGAKEGDFCSWYANGQVKIKGAYRANQTHGTWTQYSATGVVLQTTTYLDGKKHGPESLAYPDGKPRASRTYVLGKKQGPEVLYYPDGQPQAKLNWQEGALHGPCQSFHPGGKPHLAATYDRGKRNGAASEWYASGQLRSSATYREDQLDGQLTLYRDNGETLAAGTFRLGQRFAGTFREDAELPACYWINTYAGGQLTDGLLYHDDGELVDGPIHERHPDGSISRTYRFFNGRKDGDELWLYPDGQVARQMTWLANQLEGPYLEWYPNQQLRWSTVLRDGRRHGVETHWKENGEVIARGEYRDGQPWEGTFLLDTISPKTKQPTQILAKYLEGKLLDDLGGQPIGPTRPLTSRVPTANPDFAPQPKATAEADDLGATSTPPAEP